MRPSQLSAQFALHDSVVRFIDYVEGDRTLRIGVDLCNYMQPSYREGDPEMVGGELVFLSVSRVASNRSLDTLQWGEDRLDGEILTVKPVVEGEEGVEFVIGLTDYTSRASDVLVLRIFGEDVAWVPETDQASSGPERMAPASRGENGR